MPIIIKNFNWKQTERTLTVTINLRGVVARKADILIYKRYLKLAFERYFFEAVLLNDINPKESKCTITSNEVIFEITKCEEKLWDYLEPDVSKTEKMKMKLDIIKEEEERFQKECQERREKKCELKRVAVRQQIEVDSKIRNTIEEIKKSEEKQALGDINQWAENLPKRSDRAKIIELNDEEEIVPKIKPFPNMRRVCKKKKEVQEVPKPRTSRSLQVLFTPREFPTPLRESKVEEENEWLRKQAEARRTAGFISEDIRPEERNPQFLLAKGNEFLKNRNYLGAISAYSFGIKLSKGFVDLYIARSEAHFDLGNYHKCINDCSEALKLMTPIVEANKEQRALCIGRRGVSLIRLNVLKHGIDELKASLKLIRNEKFQEELNEAEKALEDLKKEKENK